MASAGSKRNRLRFVLIIVLVIAALGILIVWQLLLPQTDATSPAVLTDEDRRKVAEVCRDQTVWLAAKKLRDGEVRNFAWLVPKLMKMKIHRFIVDQDGSIRVYVGYPDRTATDGYGDLWRHQVVKTNGVWKVVRSY